MRFIRIISMVLCFVVSAFGQRVGAGASGNAAIKVNGVTTPNANLITSSTALIANSGSSITVNPTNIANAQIAAGANISESKINGQSPISTSGSTLTIDPYASRTWIHTQNGNVVLNIGTNAPVDGVPFLKPILLYWYDSGGSHTLTLSSSGTGGTTFTGMEKVFGFGTNAVIGGTNLYILDWDGTTWHGEQATAKISLMQISGTPEADVASATTTDLGAQTTRNVRITGTTTITGFGTVTAGTMVWGRFAAALTLTHNATSLILPSGASITTAANDRFSAVSLGSGNWLVYFYQKSDGTALVASAGGTSVYLGSSSVSNPSFQTDQFAANATTNLVVKSGATVTNVVNAGKITLTDAATVATDASLGNLFQCTLGGNRTLGNPTNGKNGQRAVWELIQDGTGSRTITMDTKFRFGTDITGITLTTTAAKRDYITAIYDSTADKWDVVGFVRGF